MTKATPSVDGAASEVPGTGSTPIVLGEGPAQDVYCLSPQRNSVVVVELAPGTDPYRVPGYAPEQHIKFDNGWAAYPFRVHEPTPGCEVLLDCEPPNATPLFLDDGYTDPRVAGYFHGTDCNLSEWVKAKGVGPIPDCQRLASGGHFPIWVLPKVVSQ